MGLMAEPPEVPGDSAMWLESRAYQYGEIDMTWRTQLWMTFHLDTMGREIIFTEPDEIPHMPPDQGMEAAVRLGWDGT